MVFLKLIRLPNLLMIALTQILVRYCIIIPAFSVEYKITNTFPEHLSKIQFLLLVISTVLIAAGGYIINDIEDTDIDSINKPGKNKINNGISESLAMKIYVGLTSIGVICGFAVAIMIGKLSLGFIPLFSAISLYMYSTFYKKRMLSGNIIIAILSSLSVLIVGLFEPEFYRNIIYLIWYAVFAFEVSLIREIIKDIEDIDGDERAQAKTFPVLFGIKKSKYLIFLITLITAVSIIYVLSTEFSENKVVSVWFLYGLFIIPLIMLSYWLSIAEEKKDYHAASVFTKAYMLMGIGSIFGFWYYFLR